jgi:hypothetical protein
MMAASSSHGPYERVQLATSVGFRSPGLHEYLRRLGPDSQVNQARETLATRLVELYHRHAHADWHWFEEDYRIRLSHASIVSGRPPARKLF